ncbi:MAG: exported protein of unknown function [Methanothrix sp.]|jgi:uncharacterized protein YunC (DUF1805 family)|nr:MAG: exported protein of unknown function [Methanothrix sp.]
MIMMIKMISIISALTTVASGDEGTGREEKEVSDLQPQAAGEGSVLEETVIMEELEYGGGVAKGYVIPIGPAKIVFAVGIKGMVGCGAFDVLALERFGYPAARVKATESGSIESLEDLFKGEVKDANGPAAALGVEVGMRGRDALELL